MKLKQTGPLAPIDEPWTLIRDAVYDLGKQERLKSVRIYMNEWHHYFEGECLQCLAGCVMSRRLGADTKGIYRPGSFDGGVDQRLRALDCFGIGLVVKAYNDLKLPMPKNVPHRYMIPGYADHPKEFKKMLLKLADLLESECTSAS